MNSVLAGALVLAFPCAAIAQVAILQIRVVEGEGAVHEPGSRMARPLVIEVTEETGRPVAGAAVSFQLPPDGPGGVFASGLKTEAVITGGNGRAELRHLRLNHSPGPFQIRITAAKEQVRAGTVSQQYISEPGARSGRAPAARGKSHKKWIGIALLAGGAFGGALAGLSGRSQGAAAPAPAPAPPALRIGAPTISVGKP